MPLRPTRPWRYALTLATASLAACVTLPGTPPPAFVPGAVAAADPGSALPAGWQHGVFMQIFVRAWRDSDGDGIGDLRGLTASLDYLQQLGIRGLWLMPVTRSSDGDHGYAVQDYRGIEPAYGSLDDFDTLLREAHRRGIGVIVDQVINHASAQHPAFRRAAAVPGDALRDWFVWQEADPGDWRIFKRSPWHATPTGHYFGSFGPQMPDFNLRQPAALAWHEDNMRYWLNRGVDGFRFDAVTHLVENGPTRWSDQPESRALMQRVQGLLAGYRHRWMVCEAPSAPQAWATPETCGSAFAFDLTGPLLAAARGDAEAVARVGRYFETAPPGMATMLSNHDLFAGRRAWDQLGGDAAAYRLAAATYLLLPGTPFVYYGEEIGMAGAAALRGDAQLRTPMSWTADGSGFSRGTAFRAPSDNRATHNVAAAQADPQSLLAHYTAMIALRNTDAALARGSYHLRHVGGTVLAFERRLGEARTLVLINYGPTVATLPLDGLGAGTRWRHTHPAGGAMSSADSRGQLHFALAPQSLRVLRLQP